MASTLILLRASTLVTLQAKLRLTATWPHSFLKTHRAVRSQRLSCPVNLSSSKTATMRHAVLGTTSTRPELIARSDQASQSFKHHHRKSVPLASASGSGTLLATLNR